MISLQLTPDEAEFLCDVIDFWAGDIDAAYLDVLNDRSVEDAEQYLRLVSGMEEQMAMTATVQGKVLEALNGNR